jgi:hypothetical protein
MRELIEEAGHRVSMIPFTVANFPANLTRTGIVAKVCTPDASANFGQASASEQTQPIYGAQSDFDYST